ncbi:coiled-coil domain-containing protein 81-like [Cygnus olor]|uniref:coiled-coil domain-containing protein 81-like n=1 Tax=Cygnus olor TaxID=8869 RepID=UPI001ADE69A2|nr:coiled-coil domain-containing protein 81-like [Cygnus olor]
MEGGWRVTITSDLTSAFPVLLQLSPKETEAIWDAVSEYILEELKQDKGVQVAGLGTFAVVQEQFHGKQELLLVRRPFFQLDIDELWLEEIYCPTEILPDGVKIEPLNYVQLSQATSFPLHVVKNCVQETILLYCFLLRSKEHVPFGFRDIGVLTCEDGFLCMKFYLDCVKRLESTAGLVALLHSRMWPAHLTAFSGETTARGIQMFPRFHLTVRRRPEAKVSTTSQEEAAGESRTRRVSECHPDNLLQRRKKLSLPMLTSWEPGTRQQDLEKKPSTSVLPPCPGSSPGTKKADRQETAPRAKSTTTALPAPEASRRVLQVPALPCGNDRAVWACTKASLCGAIPSRSLGMRSFSHLLPPSSLPQETEGGVPHTFPASYCLPCCHEPLHFDQGPWKRNKAFLGH